MKNATKSQAQEIYTNFLNDVESATSMSNFQNENAGGYDHSEVLRPSEEAVRELEEQGFAFVSGVVYDRADFDAMRNDWNKVAAIVKPKSMDDVKKIESETKISWQTLQSLKFQFEGE